MNVLIEKAARNARWLRVRSLPHTTVMLLLVALQLAGTARAQLAITEMMSFSQSTGERSNLVKNSDLWELTNFGTNIINLAGYKFSDNSDSPKTLVKHSAPLWIGAGESVIFVHDNVFNTSAQVRAWWGSCLDSNVQIRFYDKNGFSSCGDGIRLYDANENLIDSIDFDAAISGRSFVYDTNSGVFGDFSTLGAGGACRAATADNIASPGTTTGPIPLRIVQQPASLVACAEQPSTFTAMAFGMPRPHYQWLFNDEIIEGATQALYTVPSTTSTTTGNYSVRVTNAFASLKSANAFLAIDTNPSAPVILTAPVDRAAITNRPARFSVVVCAFPPPNYQWFSNGMVLPGETGKTLVLPRCTLAMSGTEYCVEAINSSGRDTACAKLEVTIKPDLRFTEIHAYPSTNCDAHHDWFELSNFGAKAVNLLGYRFSDVATLSGAKTVTRPIWIQPGESVIFAKTPTNQIFVDWWGPDQLPAGLQIFHYCGFSLGKDGDSLYLWNAEAEFFDEYIDSVSFAFNTQGVSIRFDAGDCFFGCESVPGEAGAFRAQQCGDIGSPGYTANPPLRFISLAWDSDGAHLTWRATEGKTYQVEYSSTLQTNGWVSLGQSVAKNNLATITDSSATAESRRFYRIGQLEP